MTEKMDIFLTEQQMLALGSQLNLPLSQLSPLVLRNDSQASASRERVLNPELVGADGKLLPALAPAFQTLAEAGSFGTIGYVGRSYAFEVATYYPPGASPLPAVSLSQTEDGLHLQGRAAAMNALEMLRQYVGDTILQRVEIELDLSIMDAWLLFAVVDAARKQAIQNILDGSKPEQRGFSFSEILELLESPEGGLQWLAPYFDDCMNLARPGLKEVGAGLNRLAAQGLVTVERDTVFAEDPLDEIVAEFLLIDGHIRARAAVLNSQSEALSTDVRAIQGRSGAVLLWSYDQGSIQLIGISPAQLMVVISDMVENPGEVLRIG
jgi:hypothetical protein